MAMRNFVQFRYSLERKVVDIFLKATIGSSGAVTLVTAGNNSQGVASIAKQVDDGKYLITLQDKYNKLLNVQAVVQNASGIAAAPDLGIVTTGTDIYPTGNSGGTVMIQLSAAGVATNLASGDTLFLQITLGDSSV